MMFIKKKKERNVDFLKHFSLGPGGAQLSTFKKKNTPDDVGCFSNIPLF